MYEYKAKVIKVYDGDTVTVILDLGFNVTIKERLRLAGINTPEVRGVEKVEGKISRDRLRELILGEEVIVKTSKRGKYGRYIAKLIHGGVVINDWLVEEGLAVYKEY